MTAKPISTAESRSETAAVAPRMLAARDAHGMKVVESRDLFGPATEIGILHDGALYRLKITRQGKLILNK